MATTPAERRRERRYRRAVLTVLFLHLFVSTVGLYAFLTLTFKDLSAILRFAWS